jgi:hypothetical protein
MLMRESRCQFLTIKNMATTFCFLGLSGILFLKAEKIDPLKHSITACHLRLLNRPDGADLQKRLRHTYRVSEGFQWSVGHTKPQISASTVLQIERAIAITQRNRIAAAQCSTAESTYKI